MADLDGAVPLDDVPDLSDLTAVILNVETSEGRQLTMIVAPEAVGDRLSLEQAQSYGADDERWVWTVVRTRE